jgi:hypothetical protein
MTGEFPKITSSGVDSKSVLAASSLQLPYRSLPCPCELPVPTRGFRKFFFADELVFHIQTESRSCFA